MGAYASDDAWKKSSFSGLGNCVEVAVFDGNTIGVRDSKDASGPALRFTSAEWAAFTAGVRAGEFDL